MNPTTPIPYDQAVTESYKRYHANSYGWSEYQEQDYKSGYADGYNAAMNNIALRNRNESLREKAAIAAMQGLLVKNGTSCSPDHVAHRAIMCANAITNKLNTPQQ